MNLQLDQALAAVRAGDILVVPKLNRLARSVPDARAIRDDLAALQTCTSQAMGGFSAPATYPVIAKGAPRVHHTRSQDWVIRCQLNGPNALSLAG
ncbi:recombinase family protein [Streptomyces sp. NPDC001982]|uniref:recombinase family protein n=1 Tax=Streptomyces sp. NPDC001982 TaxID=3154405 RepID=UPI003317099E